MLNITTEYPIMKGEQEVQIMSMQTTLCNLIDELKYILPQLDNALQNASAGADEGSE